MNPKPTLRAEVLRILLVEDAQADFLLTLRALEQDGMVLHSQRVDRTEELRAALAESRWDAVISDYSIPGLSFREVLGAVQGTDPDLPLILFSGSVGEEKAVELLKLGVRDYVLKDRPGRLPAALRQALEESRIRRERRDMQQELNHLQRLESIGRLAGGVSHDMNNVLGAIMALAEIMAARPGEAVDVARGAQAILDAAARGRDLVKGLTDFARKDIDNAVPVDLNDLVRREADLLGRTTFRKVAIRLELEPGLAPVLGEPSALANILMNLGVNACDAMPDGGHLDLATRTLGDGRVELAVADDGEGMPAEVAARALEPFFTTKPAGKGTGLGLSVVYGTVKAHGGTLDLRSAPGAGTRVALAFPPYAADRPAPEVPAAAALVPAAGLRVLLVDDDELIRQSVPALLEALGQQAVAAPDGESALALLAGGLVADLVILDLNMPGLPGLETLDRIRALRPELPVLVATGQRDPATLARIRAVPRVEALDKPFRLADLARELARIAPGN
jgi:signal transduction histidine kinase